MTSPARVWALLGDKGGDNAQVLGLARALDRPFREIHLRYNALHALPNWLLGASLVTLKASPKGIDDAAPSLVIAVGQRSAPIARAIKKRSQGRTRLVQIGRPRAPLGAFDLVLSTPQYRLPDHAHLELMDLPISGVDAEAHGEARADAREQLRGRGEAIALLVGGDSGPFVFDEAAARDLGHRVLALANERDARVFTALGRRVRPASARALKEALGDRSEEFHLFGASAENPYDVFVKGADLFVVTADSVSMMGDAYRSERAMMLYFPPQRPALWLSIWRTTEKFIEAVLPQSWWNRLVINGVLVPDRRNELVGEELLRRPGVGRLGDVIKDPESREAVTVPRKILDLLQSWADEKLAVGESS